MSSGHILYRLAPTDGSLKQGMRHFFPFIAFMDYRAIILRPARNVNMQHRVKGKRKGQAFQLWTSRDAQRLCSALEETSAGETALLGAVVEVVVVVVVVSSGSSCASLSLTFSSGSSSSRSLILFEIHSSAV